MSDSFFNLHEVLNLTESSWVEQLVIFFVATLLIFYIAYFFLYFMRKRIQGHRRIWYPALMQSIGPPLGIFIWMEGCIAMFSTLNSRFLMWPMSQQALVLEKFIMIVLLIWFGARFVSESRKNAIHLKDKHRLDLTTIHACTKLAHIFVFVIGGLLVLQLFGVPLSGVVALGGGSALVIGIAAKDLLANFFGGWVVVIDKPFKVDDLIRSPDRPIEGTVEYIGWRSTRIRTFDKRPLYVPNSVFTTISIENVTRMQNRCIKTRVGIRYADVSQLPLIAKDIEAMFAAAEEVDQRYPSYAALVNFGDSSLDIEFCTYTKVTDSILFQKVQQDIFLRIMAIIANHKAEIAFPTQTVIPSSKE